MKKLITLVAAATLAASPFAFAEDQAQGTNGNDVMQAVPAQNGSNGQMNVADNSATPAAAAADQSATDATKPATKKHHVKKHHAKKHHQSHKPAADTQTSANDAAKAPTDAPAQLADNSADAQAPAQTPAQ